MFKPASAVATTQAGFNRRNASPHDSSSGLPDEALVVIQPTRSWVPLNIGDLWASRELLSFLTWRDLKVRYKQSILGVGWVVMQPLLLTIVFTIFLGKLARVPSNNFPYPLLVLTGLLP